MTDYISTDFGVDSSSRTQRDRHRDTQAGSQADRQTQTHASEHLTHVVATGNKSVPIQLVHCRFPGLAISTAKILIHFSSKIYGSNFIKQHWETVTL